MNNLRQDFPILMEPIHGKPLIYLDNGATSQKPHSVIEAMTRYYHHDHANVHRGVHELMSRATLGYERTRKKIQEMIHAAHKHEIIFTSGTTESINLIAQSYGRTHFKAGDEVIISIMEHHSNIVPWQILQKELGIQLKIIPLSHDGELDLLSFQRLFSNRTKLVSVTHASNVLGTINPLHKIIEIAHANKVPVLVDGAQAFPHLPVDVKALDVDFYTFSAHKAYGPTGVGVLYGKETLLEKMQPYQCGGGMIEQVFLSETTSGTTFAPLPYKFEAGTPNIANVVGFYEALLYLEKIGMKNIVAHEHDLLVYANERLSDDPAIKIIGTANHKIGVISFVYEGIHAHDIGTILDQEGIAVRVGHHCTMPLMAHYQIPACVRVSFGLYNTRKDIDALIRGLKELKRIFK